MQLREPLFRSRVEFNERMDAAGLTTENCTYRAANSIVSFADGISIANEHQVRRGFEEANHDPLMVEVDADSKNPMLHKAEVMCAACGMCVVVAGGFTDVQSVSIAPESRECPVFPDTPE